MTHSGFESLQATTLRAGAFPVLDGYHDDIADRVTPQVKGLAFNVRRAGLGFDGVDDHAHQPCLFKVAAIKARLTRLVMS